MGPAGPVWAGPGPPLLPSQLLLLTCILSGGLWWGSDVCSLAPIGSNAAWLALGPLREPKATIDASDLVSPQG